MHMHVHAHVHVHVRACQKLRLSTRLYTPRVQAMSTFLCHHEGGAAAMPADSLQLSSLSTASASSISVLDDYDEPLDGGGGGGEQPGEEGGEIGEVEEEVEPFDDEDDDSDGDGGDGGGGGSGGGGGGETQAAGAASKNGDGAPVPELLLRAVCAAAADAAWCESVCGFVRSRAAGPPPFAEATEADRDQAYADFQAGRACALHVHRRCMCRGTVCA